MDMSFYPLWIHLRLGHQDSTRSGPKRVLCGAACHKPSAVTKVGWELSEQCGKIASGILIGFANESAAHRPSVAHENM